jgi:hypothetical protein
LKLLALLGDEEFRITDDVDKQDVPDLQLDLFLNFGGHVTAGILRISRGERPDDSFGALGA